MGAKQPPTTGLEVAGRPTRPTPTNQPPPLLELPVVNIEARKDWPVRWSVDVRYIRRSVLKFRKHRKCHVQEGNKLTKFPSLGEKDILVKKMFPPFEFGETDILDNGAAACTVVIQ